MDLSASTLYNLDSLSIFLSPSTLLISSNLKSSVYRLRDIIETSLRDLALSSQPNAFLIPFIRDKIRSVAP